MYHRADRDEDNAVETEWRTVDLRQVRFAEERGHKQARRDDDQDGPDALQCAAPTSRLPDDIRAEHEVEEAGKQDVDVP